jgi:hypothetical protein
MKPIKLRIARCAKLTAPACAALLLYPVATRAIGPDTQIILDADAVAAPNLNDACAIGYFSGTNFIEDGSGSTIGYQVNTNANGTTSVVFSILTANHVATSPNAQDVEWGSGNPNGPYAALSYLMGANVTSIMSCPAPNPVSGIKQDMALMSVTVTYADFNAAAGKNELPLVENNLISLQPYMSPGIFTNNGSSFTELGYGTAGKWNGTRYVGVGGLDDARRFQNNTTLGLTGGGLVKWANKAPSAAGGGASFGGDSGGPYLFGGPGTASSYTTNGIPVQFSNYEQVVHVAGDTNNIPNTKLPGDLGYGEPLVKTGNAATGSFDWAVQYAGANNDLVCTIPEPAVAGLLVVGLGCFLARRRTRA